MAAVDVLDYFSRWERSGNERERAERLRAPRNFCAATSATKTSVASCRCSFRRVYKYRRSACSPRTSPPSAMREGPERATRRPRRWVARAFADFGAFWQLNAPATNPGPIWQARAPQKGDSPPSSPRQRARAATSGGGYDLPKGRPAHPPEIGAGCARAAKFALRCRIHALAYRLSPSAFAHRTWLCGVIASRCVSGPPFESDLRTVGRLGLVGAAAGAN